MNVQLQLYWNTKSNLKYESSAATQPRKKIWDAKSKKLTSWNPWNAFLHIYDRLKKANVCILKDFRCTHVLCVGIYNHNMKSAINQVVFIFKIAQFSSCLQLGKANNFPEERNGSHLKVQITQDVVFNSFNYRPQYISNDFCNIHI